MMMKKKGKDWSFLSLRLGGLISPKADGPWHNASTDWMPINHLSRLPGFIEVAGQGVAYLVLMTELRSKFNKHADQQGKPYFCISTRVEL